MSIASDDLEVSDLESTGLNCSYHRIDDDDFDRRPQRRRQEEPLSFKIKRQFLTLAESVCLH